MIPNGAHCSVVPQTRLLKAFCQGAEETPGSLDHENEWVT